MMIFIKIKNNCEAVVFPLRQRTSDVGPSRNIGHRTIENWTRNPTPPTSPKNTILKDRPRIGDYSRDADVHRRCGVSTYHQVSRLPLYYKKITTATVFLIVINVIYHIQHCPYQHLGTN